jgi:hypothetical protein
VRGHSVESAAVETDRKNGKAAVKMYAVMWSEMARNNNSALLDLFGESGGVGNVGPFINRLDNSSFRHPAVPHLALYDHYS